MTQASCYALHQALKICGPLYISFSFLKSEVIKCNFGWFSCILGYDFVKRVIYFSVHLSD